MIEFFSSGTGLTTLALVTLLPAAIIAAGEIQERLRQQGSPLQHPIATVRNVLLPLVAVWALVVLVVGVDTGNIVVRLLGSAIVIVATAAILQVVRYLVSLLGERSARPGRNQIPQLLLLLPRLAVILTAAFFVFRVVWDVDLTGLFAALGVTSLVISVALQDTLSGLASGFLLLGDRPFSPGDWIQVDDIEGVVVDVNWRSSRVIDRNGDLQVIPNAIVAGATVINFAQPSTLHRVTVPVQVAYSNAPTRAKDMLLAAARATPGVLEEPAPDAKVTQIDDPLMTYAVHLWIDDYARGPQVFSDFGSLVWYFSNRMDVPLPSPAYDLYHHDPIQEAADAAVTPAQIVERLQSSPLLAELSEVDLMQLSENAEAVHFADGEEILGAGEVNRSLLVIWRGQARMSVPGLDGRAIELGEGDIFGLLSRFRSIPTQPTVRAVGDCETIEVDGETAAAVTSRNPNLANALNQTMESRRRRFETAPATPSATLTETAEPAS